MHLRHTTVFKRVSTAATALAFVLGCSASDPNAETGTPGSGDTKTGQGDDHGVMTSGGAGHSGEGGQDTSDVDSDPLVVPDDDSDPVFDTDDLPAPPGCGDGELTADEACDDGNRTNDDGCAANCLSVNQGFECVLPGQPCERTDVCGDSIVSGLETCDDGNATAGDGCSAVCFLERDFICPVPGQPCQSTAVCGDGRVATGETCDDGDTGSDDGCSSDCQLEPGWNCSSSGFACLPVCGDGVQTVREGCDDGNTNSGDGCDANCVLELGFACPPGESCHETVCGDGIAEGAEPCDDGNNADMGDGCSPGCRLEPDCTQGECHSRCGDGLILASDDETCDDGNNLSGDGCSSDCQIEPGFSCDVSGDTDEGMLELPVVYRDFISRGYDEVELTDGRIFQGHPDFGAQVIELKNMVELELAGPGDTINVPYKPVYNDAVLATQTDLVASRASFNQWYTEDETVNLTFIDTMTLTPTDDGAFEFDDQTFFPLDGRGFSDPDLALDGISTESLTGLCDAPEEEHAFLFTSEVRYWFEYRGGEQLIFRGDDDVWVFIKNRLIVDLGGIHGALGADVCGNTFHPDFPLECAGLDADTVDRSGEPLALIEGQVYEIAVFQAERRSCQSSYRLTLSGFTRLRTTCESACGDGVIAGDERCDDGENNGAGYGFCTLDCQPGPRCGDGIVNGEESCDNRVNGDGYRLDDDSCAPDCLPPAYCGDGVIDAAFGEECDAPGQDADGYDGCNATCHLGPRCGDGVLDKPQEECDDGNRLNNDGCNVNCKPERILTIK